MINAKKAKEKIIKSISKRKYIKEIQKRIKNCIECNQFRCVVDICEYDDIAVDIHTDALCVIKWLESYGYEASFRSLNEKRAEINVSWN